MPGMLVNKVLDLCQRCILLVLYFGFSSLKVGLIFLQSIIACDAIKKSQAFDRSVPEELLWFWAFQQYLNCVSWRFGLALQ